MPSILCIFRFRYVNCKPPANTAETTIPTTTAIATTTPTMSKWYLTPQAHFFQKLFMFLTPYMVAFFIAVLVVVVVVIVAIL